MDYSVGLAQSQRVLKQRNMLGIVALLLDEEPAPHRGELPAGSQNEPHPVVDALLGEEAAGLLGGVPGRIDGDRDGVHAVVVPQLVEGAADLLRLQRARVLARRVEERDDDGLAAVLAQRRLLAVLVAHAEVADRHVRWAQRTLEAGGRLRALGGRAEREEERGRDHERGGDEDGETGAERHGEQGRRRAARPSYTS